ncbi:MAG: 50S ribosomal protein L24 [Candidatus Chaera renei]|uniref:Large ribosomal subunit protein uL24 n=1 Tax=Candidatus Chaera renei TaxID=2506947 RepID=A0A4Q0AJP4_9BACT|nr:MAG: 50S ribosomal protein L24 [Candidatus Chaera renei]
MSKVNKSRLSHRPTIRLKKGDTVIIRGGADKGKTGKITAVLPKTASVIIEGVGSRKRHIHPNRHQPRGGTKDIQVPVPVSKVSLVFGGKPTRIGYALKKDGSKTRVARSAGNKEIK